MPLSKGAKLDGYEVLGLLGSGGMGEVYRARDLVLKRDVAIKVLPSFVSLDPDRLRRFQQEAEAAAALNHPNILAVHRFAIFEGYPYLVSELLVGETLRQRLEQSPIALRKAIDWAIQIANGLAAAHDKGIVHRDLKPENLFLVTDGRIKILDFGLAKLIQLQLDPDGAAPTVVQATSPGMVMGTAGYMSPEQVRGEAVGHRADIFAFGAILYEVLTGHRAFQRHSAAETMTAVLNEDPPSLSQAAPATPPALQRILHRCLEKNPEQRFQSVSDLAFALESLSESAISSGVVHDAASRHTPRSPFAGSPGRRTMAAAAAVVFLAIVAVGLTVYMTPPLASSQVDSTQITFSTEPKRGPLFTDGSRLYFDSSGEPAEMSITGGPVVPTRILGPGIQVLDISADASKVVGLKYDVNDNNGRGRLWTTSVLGGTPLKLSDHLALAARWSPDGRSIAFVDQRTLYTIDADGRNLRKTWDGPGDLEDLSFSPDGRQLTITVDKSAGQRLWSLHADGSDAHPLRLDWPDDTDQYSGRWTPDGRHFFFLSDREGRGNVYELVARPWFEFWKKPTAVRITGNQVSIRAFTTTSDSHGLYVLGLMDEGAMRAYDPQSGKLAPFLDNLSMLQFAISPDRQWMAYTEYPSRHLWKSKLDGSEKVQLTNSLAEMQQWSPDGKWLVYSDWKNLYLISADGGAPEKLTPDGHGDLAPTWSPDGKSIAFSYYPHPNQPLRIHVLDLATRQVSTMPDAEGYFWPSWSPDGKFLVAIAENPSRMMLYSAKTATWKALHSFDTVWSYWTWASDSKSLYMSIINAKKGIYRLTVPEGEWTKLNGMEEVDDPQGTDSFMSLTSEGQPAIMSRTGVAQMYSLHWK